MCKKKGFTLVEILVASVLFFLVILGLASVFVSAKRLTLHARERMVSAEIGRFFVDSLQSEVKQDGWNNSIFVLGKAPETQTINNTVYTATYAISDVAGTDLHRVITTISFAEPAL